jgi:ribosome-binding factor A
MTRGYIPENESQRQLKASEVVRKAIVECLAKNRFLGADLFDISITVTKVKLSVDLKHAHIFVLCFEKKLNIANELNKVAHLIRRDIAKKINFKFLPQVKFHEDDTFDHSRKINDMIDENINNNERLDNTR